MRGCISSITTLVLIVAIGSANCDHEDDSTAGSVLVQGLTKSPKTDLYYAPIKVDGRTFKLLVSTSSYESWIASSESVGFAKTFECPRGKDRGDGYNFNCGRGLKFLNSVQCSVSLEIGGQTLEDQRMLVVNSTDGDVEQLNQWGINGVFGLDSYNLNKQPFKGTFMRMFVQADIQRNVYSLYLRDSQKLGQATNGVLVLGGIDERFYSGEINYLPAHKVTVHGLTLRVDQFKLDWGGGANSTSEASDDEPTGKGIPLKLDSSTPLFIGPKDMLTKFHRQIGARELLYGNNFVFDNCDLTSKPDFFISIEGGFEITIKPEQYVIELEDGGKHFCISAFLANPLRTITLGTRFLQNYYTVVDYENSRIGFAEPQ